MFVVQDLNCGAAARRGPESLLPSVGPSIARHVKIDKPSGFHIPDQRGPLSVALPDAALNPGVWHAYHSCVLTMDMPLYNASVNPGLFPTPFSYPLDTLSSRL